MKWIVLLVVLLTSCITGAFIAVEEKGDPIEVHFCPWDDCEDLLGGYLSSSRQDCAWYDAKEYYGKNIVMEKDNALKGVHTDNRGAYMHNKFCVLDDGVLFGSMNPTERGMHINYNNLVYVPSKYLSSEFAAEFEELYGGEFGGGDNVIYSPIMYNGYRLEVAFCPEDECRELVLGELDNANSSIKFVTFSFTDNEVADMLQLKHRNGVQVEGIMEGQRKTMKYNKYRELVTAGITVYPENSSATMHHKVFIIDGRTVITGSANPTKSGYENNDEVIVILEDPNVVKEFEMMYNHLSNDIMST